LKNRDAEFEQKMAEILCVYREVDVLKKAPAKSKGRRKPVAIVSYDEKPGIQAIATTVPDLPPEPGVYAAFARDHEYMPEVLARRSAAINFSLSFSHRASSASTRFSISARSASRVSARRSCSRCALSRAT
jgi:hypothetical protein